MIWWSPKPDHIGGVRVDLPHNPRRKSALRRLRRPSPPCTSSLIISCRAQITSGLPRKYQPELPAIQDGILLQNKGTRANARSTWRPYCRKPVPQQADDRDQARDILLIARYRRLNPAAFSVYEAGRVTGPRAASMIAMNAHSLGVIILLLIALRCLLADWTQAALMSGWV